MAWTVLSTAVSSIFCQLQSGKQQCPNIFLSFSEPPSTALHWQLAVYRPKLTWYNHSNVLYAYTWGRLFWKPRSFPRISKCWQTGNKLTKQPRVGSAPGWKLQLWSLVTEDKGLTEFASHQKFRFLNRRESSKMAPKFSNLKNQNVFRARKKNKNVSFQWFFLSTRFTMNDLLFRCKGAL